MEQSGLATQAKPDYCPKNGNFLSENSNRYSTGIFPARIW